MWREFGIGYFFPEISEFIHENYEPTNAERVDELIAEKKRKQEESKRGGSIFEFDPLTSLKNEARVFACESGMSKKFMTTLSAIQKMESELPDGQRILTPKRYLEFLTAAELTVAKNEANDWSEFKFKEVGLRTQRISKLLEFLEDFQ